MPRRATADYAALEKLYVTEDKTYAELAKIGNVTPQSVSEYGKRNDWPGKRMAYKAALSRRGYEQVAEAVAFKQTQILDEAIAVARATLRRYAEDIVQGKVAVTSKDAAEMIRLLMKELTPDDRREQTETTLVFDGNADSDFYRRIVETARSRISAARSVGPASESGPARTRTN